MKYTATLGLSLNYAILVFCRKRSTSFSVFVLFRRATTFSDLTEEGTWRTDWQKFVTECGGELGCELMRESLIVPKREAGDHEQH